MRGSTRLIDSIRAGGIVSVPEEITVSCKRKRGEIKAWRAFADHRGFNSFETAMITSFGKAFFRSTTPVFVILAPCDGRPPLKSWATSEDSRRRFFGSTLRENSSPTRILVCGFAGKNATRSRTKEEVSAALETAPWPPSFWGFRRGRSCAAWLGRKPSASRHYQPGRPSGLARRPVDFHSANKDGR